MATILGLKGPDNTTLSGKSRPYRFYKRGKKDVYPTTIVDNDKDVSLLLSQDRRIFISSSGIPELPVTYKHSEPPPVKKKRALK